MRESGQDTESAKHFETDFDSPTPLARTTVVVSVPQNLKWVDKHIESSKALFGSKEDALNRLYDLRMECAEPDWDGYGAEAISPIAFERSEQFIRRLPEGLPLPEISVEPDGEIALDWSPTPTQTFSVSIGTGARMACAWVNGTEHGHVVVSSNNGEIPLRILQEIQYITNNDSVFRTT